MSLTFAILAALLVFAPQTEPTTGAALDGAVAALRGAAWPAVASAADALEGGGRAAIEPLLPLLDATERVPLTETADLIWPGATETFGHGQRVDYDLDSLAIRAGWVLERLTFRDFGFRKMEVDAGGARAKAAAAAARAWWADAGAKWSRLDALRDALEADAGAPGPSPDAAVQYLRFGAAPCAGLDPASYEGDLRPRVQRLAQRAAPELAEQCALLLAEGSLPAGTALRATTVSVSIDAGLSFHVPTSWRSAPSKSAMRQAQFELRPASGDGEPAALVVYYFGESGAGGVQANLDRWKGQFKPSAGQSSLEERTEVLEVDGMRVDVLEVGGRFVAETSPGSGQFVDQEDFRLLGAIVAGPKGAVFFKLVGPSAVVAHERRAFEVMLKSMTQRA